MARELKKWDAADYLKDAEDIAAYLEVVMEDNDPAMTIKALGAVARSAGMTELANKIGVGRESLYKSLSGEGNPSFATVAKVLDVLGLRLSVQHLHQRDVGVSSKSTGATKPAASVAKPAAASSSS